MDVNSNMDSLIRETKMGFPPETGKGVATGPGFFGV